jgi:2-polyprenyl-3-methyl-5-hydroxy-6-metoxy-1,4-benzoquinol methylase
MKSGTTTRNAMTSQLPDPDKATAFAGRVLGILNGGALALMISIGHRAGLFDVMAGLPFATSAEIAKEAGLQERYVREWLGAMTTGAIVEYDPARDVYRLPAEHAASLMRAAGPGNLAVTAQWISLLGSVEDHVLDCFQHGGGVPYSAFDRFQQVMAEESDQTVVGALLDTILPLIPDRVVKLRDGADVLDVGCGSGRALNEMAAAFPASRFTGYDVSSSAIESARAEARERGLSNLAFAVRDIAGLRAKAGFDLITAFDAIHDQAHPAAVLAAIARALCTDGAFLMQEIRGTSHVDQDAANPYAPLLYTVSCLHCTTVSLAAGGDGLGAMWGAETARRMLAEAGFANVALQTLPHDPLNAYYIARKAG